MIIDKDSLEIVRGVVGANRTEMSEIMGYKERVSYYNTLSGKCETNEKAFDLLVEAGFNLAFFVDSSQPMLQKGKSIIQVRMYVWEFYNRS
jgi:hypothetical protein